MDPAAVFCVKLRPTGINENSKKRHKSKFTNFQVGLLILGFYFTDSLLVKLRRHLLVKRSKQANFQGAGGGGGGARSGGKANSQRKAET